jgi:predicted amidohydrolase YtcJ
MDIFQNARIYTFDRSLPEAGAIVVDSGRVVAAGAAGQMRSEYGGRLTIHDLEGRIVIPGLTDAHIHLENYALSLLMIDCETATKEECLGRIGERARSTQPGQWILGHGWNQNNWESGFGNAADLDAVAPNHPVYLTAKSLHAGWANSAALGSAHISASTPDPQDGRIGRDANGDPDGILFESAMELMEEAIPEPTSDELERAIQAAIPVLWRMGLTGVHDFDRKKCFAALQRLHSDGALRLRVVKSIPLEDLSHAAAIGLRTGFGDDFLRIGQVKAFADGALGPRTAAMLQPYIGEPENRGMLMIDAEELFEFGRLAVDNGLPLAVHAIGDRAIHEILNGFDQIRKYERRQGLPALRHRIEHVQVVHPDDVARLGELGVIASMQPIHATSDMRMADRYWGERSRLAYAWRAQSNHAAVLAFGSDAPVESPNPFWGLHAAVTRRRADGSPGPDGWIPEERLTVGEALLAYTTGAAYASGREDRLGKLAPGYFADLLVLDEDPFNCEPDALLEIRPRATMIAGEWVFSEL